MTATKSNVLTAETTNIVQEHLEFILKCEDHGQARKALELILKEENLSIEEWSALSSWRADNIPLFRNVLEVRNLIKSSNPAQQELIKGSIGIVLEDEQLDFGSKMAVVPPIKDLSITRDVMTGYIVEKTLHSIEEIDNSQEELHLTVQEGINEAAVEGLKAFYAEGLDFESICRDVTIAGATSIANTIIDKVIDPTQSANSRIAKAAASGGASGFIRYISESPLKALVAGAAGSVGAAAATFAGSSETSDSIANFAIESSAQLYDLSTNPFSSPVKIGLSALQGIYQVGKDGIYDMITEDKSGDNASGIEEERIEKVPAQAVNQSTANAMLKGAANIATGSLSSLGFNLIKDSAISYATEGSVPYDKLGVAASRITAAVTVAVVPVLLDKIYELQEKEKQKEEEERKSRENDFYANLLGPAEKKVARGFFLHRGDSLYEQSDAASVSSDLKDVISQKAARSRLMTAIENSFSRPLQLDDSTVEEDEILNNSEEIVDPEKTIKLRGINNRLAFLKELESKKEYDSSVEKKAPIPPASVMDAISIGPEQLKCPLPPLSVRDAIGMRAQQLNVLNEIKKIAPLKISTPVEATMPNSSSIISYRKASKESKGPGIV